MAAKGLSRMSRNSFCQTPPVERAAHWQSGHLQMMPMWMQSMATPEEFWPRKTAVASESYMMPVNCAASPMSSIAMRGGKSTMQWLVEEQRHLLHPQ